jgi:glyoxalase-like protein
MRLDHVIYGTPDLDDAAVRLEQEHGLKFLQGGRHPGGTVNSVAPLQPPQYLELLAVEEAGDSWTREVEVLLAGGRTLLGWGIVVDDVEQVAARHGLVIEAGSITSADGSTGSWRIAASDDLSLPFFVAYDGDPDSRLRRWQERVREAGTEGFGGFTFVEVGGDPERMRAWIGDSDLPIRFASGRPGLRAVGIAGPTGEIVLRDTV